MMNWDDLRIFLAVARSGSIRGAAVSLGVDHSTVSRRIAGFEDNLGVRLFERLPTGYLLTQAGEEVLPSAQRMEEETAAIGRGVAGRDASLSGLLKVTLPDSLATRLLMPDLAAFSAAHPDVELEIIPSSGYADLAKREADVAIRLTNDPPGYLVGRRLLKFAVAVYGSEAYLARPEWHDGDAAQHWVGWNDVVPDPQWVRESDYPKARVHHRVHNAVAQVAAVRAGMGLGLLPCYLGDTEPNLRRAPPGSAQPDRYLWLLTHEDLRKTVRINKFMEFMATAILSHKDLIEGRSPGKDDNNAL